MPRFLLALLSSFLLLACNEISKDVRRSDLYPEVMKHYTDAGCKEKKNAALFLFKNMEVHYAFYNKAHKLLLDSCALVYEQYQQSKPNISHALALKYVQKHLHPVAGKARKLYDIDKLSADFLIRNIDHSYQAWKKTRGVGQIDFNLYCNYILPYRVIHEPIDEDFECTAKQKYEHLIDTLIQEGDFIKIIKTIITEEDVKLDLNGYAYPYLFSVSQTSKIRGVNSCNDAIVYFARLFRALGIPATYDVTKRTYRGYSHSMLALYWQGEWHSIEVPDGKLCKRNANKCLQSFPIVLRAAYATEKHQMDVTAEYTPVVDIKYDAKVIKDKRPAIALFDDNMGFQMAKHSFIVKNDTLVFQNMGVDAVYALGYLNKSNFIAGKIVSVDIQGVIKDLHPDPTNRKDLKLYRKYLKDKRQLPYKQAWHRDVLGLVVEGSNTIDFNSYDTLFVMSDYPPPYIKNYSLKTNKRYQYVRIRNKKQHVSIAELKLYNADGDELLANCTTLWDVKKHPEILKNKGQMQNDCYIFQHVKWLHKMLDNDGLSSAKLLKVGFFMYAFAQPQKVVSFSFQAKNDENHILIGDDYELFVWDKGWHSLGRQIAKDNWLVFSDVPANGLYCLHNHSRGKEEYPFIINEQGQQYWAGQYIEADTIMQ